MKKLTTSWIAILRFTNKVRDGKLRKVSEPARDYPAYILAGRKAYYAPEQRSRGE
jgi:hypothetical protein